MMCKLPQVFFFTGSGSWKFLVMMFCSCYSCLAKICFKEMGEIHKVAERLMLALLGCSKWIQMGETD